MMLVLAIGVFFAWSQDGYRYLFEPRTQAVVETCADECFVALPTGSAVLEDASGLPKGQTLDVYPVGDIGHVAADDGGAPGIVWAFAAVVVIYLGLVGL